MWTDTKTDKESGWSMSFILSDEVCAHRVNTHTPTLMQTELEWGAGFHKITTKQTLSNYEHNFYVTASLRCTNTVWCNIYMWSAWCRNTSLINRTVCV